MLKGEETSNQKKKKLTKIQQKYQTFAKAREPKRPVFSNNNALFWLGELFVLLAKGFQWVFMTYCGFTELQPGILQWQF